ncbi:hypothetical protein [Clostridium sp. JN-1]|jgi:hypothetical protein|uniref:hypothetical protein n=1 Tax=Clostridium sp. JN-1 TaxID=2483110 RepID=UPI000F0BC343|nr:hypothetical protein [Clostridium sp. JN-1]
MILQERIEELGSGILTIENSKVNKVDGKPIIRTYKIRLCNYTNKYNYKDMDYNLLFDTKDDLLAYFKNRFDLNLTF